MDALREQVRGLLEGSVSGTPFAVRHPQCVQFTVGGKLLRAELVLGLGEVLGRCQRFNILLAAAVELVHAASLVHDDILDGATLRRGLPSMWRLMGMANAVLFGDMLFFLALRLLAECDGELLEQLSRMGCRICEGEYLQELQAEKGGSLWRDYLEIAKLKTGALFAFAAAAPVPQDRVELRRELELAGYALGAAYQIADDFLDLRGDCATTGKSSGQDRRLAGVSAVEVAQRCGVSPAGEVGRLLAEAESRLEHWPEIQEVWKDYVERRLRSQMSQCVGEA